MVDWVVSRRVNESRYAGSLTQKGTGLLVVGGALLPCFYLSKSSSCPHVDMLEQS